MLPQDIPRSTILPPKAEILSEFWAIWYMKQTDIMYLYRLNYNMYEPCVHNSGLFGKSNKMISRIPCSLCICVFLGMNVILYFILGYLRWWKNPLLKITLCRKKENIVDSNSQSFGSGSVFFKPRIQVTVLDLELYLSYTPRSGSKLSLKSEAIKLVFLLLMANVIIKQIDIINIYVSNDRNRMWCF